MKERGEPRRHSSTLLPTVMAGPVPAIDLAERSPDCRGESQSGSSGLRPRMTVGDGTVARTPAPLRRPGSLFAIGAAPTNGAYTVAGLVA